MNKFVSHLTLMQCVEPISELEHGDRLVCVQHGVHIVERLGLDKK